MSTKTNLRRFRRQLLIMTLTLTGVMATVAIALWPYFTAWYERFTGRAMALCNCSQFAVLPDQSVLLLLLVSVVVMFGVLIVRAAAMLAFTAYKTRRYEDTLRQRVQHTTQLQHIPLYRVDSPQPLAVCLGYLRPRIYISTALEHVLQPAELWTVIKHELYHAHHFDPLQRLVLCGLAALFPFMRQRMLTNFTALQEIAADEAAADDRHLRQALVKTLQVITTQPTLSAVWFTAIDARLNRLLGQRLERPNTWPIVAFASSLIVLTIVLYSVFTAQAEAAAFGQCIAEQPMCELMMSYVVQ